MCCCCYTHPPVMYGPVSTKPFFVMCVKRESDVPKRNWPSGHGVFVC